MELELLSLDFTNTLDFRLAEQPTDSLTSYASFLDWAVEKNITDRTTADRLKHAEKNPEQAFHRVLELRELLYCLLSAAARKEQVAEEDLDRFNGLLAEAMVGIRVTQTDEGFDWLCCPGDYGFEAILYRIVKSAADLLVSTQLQRLSICANPECGWLFLDFSRNHSRRWCSMESCGNRAKARRFYQRHQQSKAEQ
jgi:predicted RNA-binding Zn ribbon-like protein